MAATAMAAARSARCALTMNGLIMDGIVEVIRAASIYVPLRCLRTSTAGRDAGEDRTGRMIDSMMHRGGDGDVNARTRRRNRMRNFRRRADEQERMLQESVEDSEMFNTETLAEAAPVAQRVFNARVMRAVETALGGYSSSMAGGSARAGGKLRELLVNEMGFCVEEVRCSEGRERAYIRYGCLPGMERRTEAFLHNKYVRASVEFGGEIIRREPTEPANGRRRAL